MALFNIKRTKNRVKVNFCREHFSASLKSGFGKNSVKRMDVIIRRFPRSHSNFGLPFTSTFYGLVILQTTEEDIQEVT